MEREARTSAGRNALKIFIVDIRYKKHKSQVHRPGFVLTLRLCDLLAAFLCPLSRTCATSFEHIIIFFYLIFR